MAESLGIVGSGPAAWTAVEGRLRHPQVDRQLFDCQDSSHLESHSFASLWNRQLVLTNKQKIAVVVHDCKFADHRATSDPPHRTVMLLRVGKGEIQAAFGPLPAEKSKKERKASHDSDCVSITKGLVSPPSQSPTQAEGFGSAERPYSL
jgi:hypothetical protein